jgi:hypothetical protein
VLPRLHSLDILIKIAFDYQRGIGRSVQVLFSTGRGRSFCGRSRRIELRRLQQVDFELVLHRRIETALLIGTWPGRVFDNDKADILDRQIEFIEPAAIPWAMTGALQAPPTTPLLNE